MDATPRTVEELVALAPTRKLEYLLFWGHRPQRDGSVGAGCLSQWWPAFFAVDGHTFRTAEHYMMWRKAMMFGDVSVAEQIVAAGHPREAKMLGRGVRGFDEQSWVDRRFDIVVEASTAKFGQDPLLRDFLVGTGSRVLVEASPTDRIWGIGLSAADDGAADPARWKGLNLLGFALMQARDRLR
jgi:ribA/ribD-fused uncharacterized protein